jgi:transposase-like protein
MPRGIAHPPELRAAVVAAVLAGSSVATVARQYGLDRALVSRWTTTGRHDATVATDQRARDVDLGELILGLIGEHITTLHAQLQATARPEWLAQQSAGDIAELVATERDTLIRLLAGLRPVSDPAPASDDALPGGADSGPGG